MSQQKASGLHALATTYITLAYLWTLLQNAALGAIGLIVVLAVKGTLPSGNIVLLLFVAAFGKSLLDHLSNGKDSTVLKVILQILQQLLQQQSIDNKPTTPMPVAQRQSLDSRNP